MGTNVFLASAESPDFDDTVASGVDLDEYPDAPAAVVASAGRLWGVTDGSQNRTAFEKMASGDLVLFYRDVEYVATGRVGATVADGDEWASSTLWEEFPATMLYTVEDYAAVDVPRAAVHRIFDYSENYSPGDLMRVADSRLDRSPAAIERALSLYTERHG